MKNIIKLFPLLTTVMVLLIGCSENGNYENNYIKKSQPLSETEHNSSIIKDSDSVQDTRNELFPYLGMETEKAYKQLSTYGFSVWGYHPPYEEGETQGFYIGGSGKGNDSIAIMNAQERVYAINIYNENDFELSVMGIYLGMNADKAIEIITGNGYDFKEVYDGTHEKKGDYQGVIFKKNGVYQVVLRIYGGEKNPYGSLDETDIQTDGIVGAVEMACVLPERYEELANDVGDRGGQNGDIIVEDIGEACVELTMFTENKSFDIPGVDEYGTYVFGEGVIEVDLQPGIGAYSYATRILISDICPYKLCGVYCSMDKESALKKISELGITIHTEDKNRIMCDVDDYTTLEIQFVDGVVSFIECIDEYPEVHEKRYIEN